MRDERLPDLPAPPALTDLLDANRHQLVRAAARLLGPTEAEDAVQDAYVRALEARALELNVAQAWLLTVMRHIAIDRLRRRQWMQQWLAESAKVPPSDAQTSAESEAALRQDSTRALRLLATHLSPVEGAVLLLHEVFEVEHAEIAQAQGKTAAGSRQQLRRALARLHQAAGASLGRSNPASDLDELEYLKDASRTADTETEVLFQTYCQCLQLRDAAPLWALLRQPLVSARHAAPSASLAAGEISCWADARPTTRISGLVRVGGQLGLALSLDGVTLCVLPLGSRAEREPLTAVHAVAG
ncbi:RNA polymerase sigma factor [Hylemonella gracilis]|uniref:RNA polymerase, sigma-24 subunit, ecf subfamily protein n=1 Tax=Hylemonella gracilis ATCC 19624 TaxID=887062 RepID=F3KSH0_9BURK|nr:sigma-70 family RNA polymerase sigma factor [Hylemonella gracilis]EGI77247.1 RNA polymerase, sigma-24 subunit, ecf subfamily protein [Hylemonella gracilis ATCC 19624]